MILGLHGKSSQIGGKKYQRKRKKTVDVSNIIMSGNNTIIEDNRNLTNLDCEIEFSPNQHINKINQIKLSTLSGSFSSQNKLGNRNKLQNLNSSSGGGRINKFPKLNEFSTKQSGNIFQTNNETFNRILCDKQQKIANLEQRLKLTSQNTLKTHSPILREQNPLINNNLQISTFNIHTQNTLQNNRNQIGSTQYNEINPISFRTNQRVLQNSAVLNLTLQTEHKNSVSIQNHIKTYKTRNKNSSNLGSASISVHNHKIEEAYALQYDFGVHVHPFPSAEAYEKSMDKSPQIKINASDIQINPSDNELTPRNANDNLGFADDNEVKIVTGSGHKLPQNTSEKKRIENSIGVSNRTTPLSKQNKGFGCRFYVHTSPDIKIDKIEGEGKKGRNGNVSTEDPKNGRRGRSGEYFREKTNQNYIHRVGSLSQIGGAANSNMERQMLLKYVYAWNELGSSYQSDHHYYNSLECFLCSINIYHNLFMYPHMALALGDFMFAIVILSLILVPIFLVYGES